MIPECPLCGGTERYYSFLVGDERFDRCVDCGLLSRKVVDGGAQRRELGPGAHQAAEEAALASALFAMLEDYAGTSRASVLVLGTVSDPFLEEGRRRGFDAARLGEGERPARPCDVLVVVNLLEDAPKPVAYVESLREHLRAGGVLVVVTNQLVKGEWLGQGGRILAAPQRHSFSDTNLQSVLWMAGFGDVFLNRHLEAGSGRAPRRAWDPAIAFARMRERREAPRLSVIVPVFNEATTVRQVLDALADKHIPGLEIEVVVIESASTDGSREIVLEYEGRPRFRVVLEDRPQGKGHAVRNGFRHASGDVLLIQDADLEYDFLDYEMLVSPILRGKTAFVLGTRHAGNWKIRKFAQQFLVADVLNLAHWFLVELANRLYGQSMTDPVTMFKVFRADCLSGLELECNRFDLDWELVCKLLRKGYTPLEIPVNYQSRSFREGKKVRILRDPPSWLRAMLKYRYTPVYRVPRPSDAPGADGARDRQHAERAASRSFRSYP